MRTGLISMLVAFPAVATAQGVWVVAPQPILDIPGVDASGAVVFQNLGGASRLSDGSLLVVDRGSTSIRRFDATGKLVTNVGRQGTGPGEYQIIISGNGCGSDSLLVWARETTIMVGRSGAPSRTFIVPADSTRLRPLRTFSCLSNGSIAYITQPLGRPAQSPSGMFHPMSAAVIVDRTGKFVRRVDSIPGGEWMPVPRGAFPRPLGPASYLTAVGDRMVVGYTDSARVWVIEPDGRRTPLSVPSTPRAPTAEEFRNAVSAIAEMAPVQLRPTVEPEIAKAPVPATLPPYFELFGDPDGNLWIQLSPPGAKRTELIAMNLRGQIVARTTIPMAVTIHEIGRDHIVASYVDSGDEIHLAVFSLHKR